MKRRKRHKIAPIVLATLKKIPYGKAAVLIKTEKFKANSVRRFLKRRHERRQLQEFKCITRIMPDPRRKNTLINVIFIARKLNISRSVPLTYIV